MFSIHTFKLIDIVTNIVGGPQLNVIVIAPRKCRNAAFKKYFLPDGLTYFRIKIFCKVVR